MGWGIGDGSKFKQSVTGNYIASGAVNAMAVLGMLVSNVAATGDPLIQGTLEEGLFARADTSNVRDDNGLTQVSYRYEWIRVDGGAETTVPGVNGSTYPIAAADVGKTLKVRVTFTDDQGNRESRTSSPSAAVAAGPTTYLVKNLAQADGEDVEIDTTTGTFLNGRAYAQQFTVGGDFGIALQSVRLAIGADSSVVPRVSIYSDDLGVPGTSLQVLTNPSSGIDGSTDTVENFTASSLVLNARQSYWVVIEMTSPVIKIQLRTTPSTSEDVNPAQGWSIGDAVYVRAYLTTTFLEDSSATLKVGLLGEVVANQRAAGTPFILGTPEVNLTLALRTSQITDANGLTSVRFSYQWIRVDGGTETDIDGATSPLYKVQAADVGKTLRVRASFFDDAGYAETATSEPSPTVGAAETYLLANLGSESTFYEVASQPGLTQFAQPFTTGDHGATVSALKVEASAPAGTDVRSSIYSDNSGVPGTLLVTLAPNTEYVLTANTRYWFVFDRASGTSEFAVTASGSLDVDDGGATNWRIDQNLWYYWQPLTSWYRLTTPAIIAVRVGLQGENRAPAFASSAQRFDVVENTTSGQLGAVTATDSEGDSIVYSVGGPDAAAFQEDFSLNSSSGTINVKSDAAIDYEEKASVTVTVTAADAAGGTDTIEVTVNVSDADDPGTVRLSTTVPVVGRPVTATIADQDGGVVADQWSWSAPADGVGIFLPIEGEESATYVPRQEDIGK